MKRALFVTSLVCSALVGCGDDKNPGNDTTVTPTNPPPDETSEPEDSTSVGMSSMGTEETGPPPNPTSSTMPDGTDDTGPDPSAGTTMMTTFLQPTDIPTEGGCNPFTQDCPDGEKCVPYADDGGGLWNNDQCQPIPEDAAQIGDPCIAEGGGVAGIDNCDKGAFCWDVDMENMGFCVELCKGSTESGTCDDVEKTCAIYNEGTLPLCLDQCDPLSQNCDPSDVCIGNPTGEGFLCVLDASGEEGQQHDPCMFANACDAGLLCNDATSANECDPNAQGCCEPFCDLTDPDADANCGGAGQVCNPYFEEGMAPPDYVDVGYCAIPM